MAEVKKAMILNRLLQLFQKEPEPTPDGDEDLKKVESDQEEILSQFGKDRPSGPPGPGAWTAMLVGASLIAGLVGALAGRFTAPGSCTVNRPGVLVTRDGHQWTGLLVAMDHAGALFKKGENQAERFDFASISRIIFFRDQQEFQNAGADSMGFAGALGSFPGTYNIESGGHKGEMNIYFTPVGTLTASVRFLNWGTRQPENLTSLKVLGNRIDFRRACAGLECRRIGSSYDFYQDYVGYMDPTLKEIKGTYSGDHSSGTWVARKRP